MDGDLFCVAPQLLTRTKARSFQRFLSRTAEQGTQFERQRGKKWLCMIVVRMGVAGPGGQYHTQVSRVKMEFYKLL